MYIGVHHQVHAAEPGQVQVVYRVHSVRFIIWVIVYIGEHHHVHASEPGQVQVVYRVDSVRFLIWVIVYIRLKCQVYAQNQVKFRYSVPTNHSVHFLLGVIVYIGVLSSTCFRTRSSLGARKVLDSLDPDPYNCPIVVY